MNKAKSLALKGFLSSGRKKIKDEQMYYMSVYNKCYGGNKAHKQDSRIAICVCEREGEREGGRGAILYKAFRECLF